MISPAHNVQPRKENANNYGLRNRKPSIAQNGRRDVDVHIMDKNNEKVMRKFQCEKRVIIEGMTYFKQHLKDADQFNTIDI